MAATKTQTLPRITMGDRIIRFILWRRRLSRLLFISPAEAQFIRVMRGHVLVVPWLRSRHTRFPLAIVLSLGYLKHELIEREVRVGRYVLDFATPQSRILKAIEIDGAAYHTDIVREQERDEYLHTRGWSVMHIPARRVFQEPRRVYVETKRFLRS